QIPSQFRTVTAQDLDNAKQDLIDAFDASLDKAKIKADSSDLFMRIHNLCENFEQMTKLKIDAKGYEFIKDSSGTDYVAKATDYYNWLDPKSAYDQAQVFMNDLAASPTSASKKFGLYSLIGSLMVSYLKCSVTWNWGKEVRASLLYHDYWLEEEKWMAKSAAHRAAYPAEEPIKPDTSLSNPLPSWQDWREEPRVPVHTLVEVVNSLIAECEGDGKYAKLKANWEDRNLQVFAPYSQITLKDDGNKNFWVEDSESGTKTDPSSGDATMQWAMLDLMIGSKVAYYWQKFTDLYDLDGVKKEDIDKFYETVDTWKKVRDTMLFRTATVDPANATMPGSTLIDVARTYFYTYDDLFYYIVKANPSTFADASLIDKDQVLIIPDLDGTSVTANTYTVQSGDTLASIAKAQLGDESYASNIFAANGQQTKPKWIKTGETIGIPDLKDGSPTTTYTFKAGDTWTSLASAFYPDADLQAFILSANATTVNPTVVMPDQVIKFPDLPDPKAWYPPGPDDPDDPDDPGNFPGFGPGGGQ
ncbi:MAG: LysM peptidoglycan-binding domain-containing protein, partial [Acidobacteriota bacterium]|nr:LysM peptidoglycan-binding domain-containing protein [Acidobacteriota bacterium]